MTWEIRPATDDERQRFVRSTWRRSFVLCDAERRVRETSTGRLILNPASDSRMFHSPLGSWEMIRVRGPSMGRLSSRCWLAAHIRLIEELLPHATVMVAHIGGECLGWIAYDLLTLHYVYVAPKVRRRGIGRALMQHALEHSHCEPTHMTSEGELLIADVLREKPRSHTQSPVAAQVHDG